jgi:Spy/CpxP family protein refolding chaperone
MKRHWKIGLGIVGALAVALVAGGAAFASGHGFGHEGFAKRRITRHIDAALDAINATPQQRDAIHAARDHVFDSFAEAHQSHANDLQEALGLWQADQIDASGVAALRARHQAAAKQAGDAVVQALSDAHDALTAPQRQQLATYLRAHQPPKMDGAAPFFQHMMNERVDDVLDQIHATAAQRTTVKAAVQRVFTVMTSNLGNHGAQLDRAIAVFTADKLDPAQVAQLRADHQAQMQQVGDAVVQALTDIHDALDAGQRKTVAQFILAHHAKHGG